MLALFFPSFLNRLFQRLSPAKHKQATTSKEQVKALIGVEPTEVSVYLHALQLSPSTRQKFEQLEFLGDAVINLAVSEWLLERFPRWKEGQLSEWKAWLVSRRTCNQVAKLTGIEKLLKENTKFSKINIHRTNIAGNTLEALIGAVMIDKGYEVARSVVVRLWSQHLEQVVRARGAPPPMNYKGRLLAWGQKNKKKVALEVERLDDTKEFKARVIIDGQKISEGRGRSRYAAEEQAARLAWRKLRGEA